MLSQSREKKPLEHRNTIFLELSGGYCIDAARCPGMGRSCGRAL